MDFTERSLMINAKVDRPAEERPYSEARREIAAKNALGLSSLQRCRLNRNNPSQHATDEVVKSTSSRSNATASHAISERRRRKVYYIGNTENEIAYARYRVAG